ncbi:MAG: phosphotransferase [Anaerolineae bacterium]|jgi:spectinomycin phosphotransferase
MLERPDDISDERISDCLRAEYGLSVEELTFLPLGADFNTAVFRAVAQADTPYFVKLRRGNFREITVTLPKYLSDQGVAEIIPPLTARAGKLCADLDPFTLILYPFIEGRDGYEVALSPAQWATFGSALKRLHIVALPPALAAQLPRESYSPRWRESLMRSLDLVEGEVWTEPVAAETATFMRAHRDEALDLIARAERYAGELQAHPRPSVVCHADTHAANLLIDGDGRLYIIDWDDPIWAPKERDLMFIGGVQGFTGTTPEEEERLFYRGYGPTQIDPVALAYYRYARIIEDLAIYCEQLLLTDEGGADRPQSLRYLMMNFDSGGTIDMARRAEGM